MKRILVILFCTVCVGTALQAQDVYRIHEFFGNVEYKLALTNDPWQPVYKGLELSSIDSLRYGINDSVRVMYLSSRNVYNSLFKKTRKTNIYFFVEEAKNADAKHISEGIFTSLLTGKKKKVEVHEMKMIGAASRGAVQSGDTIKRMAEMFAWIGAQACSGQPSPTEEGLTFRKKPAFGEWDFIYENNTGKNYFMNVLHINKLTNRVSLCYVTTYKGSGSTSCPIVPTGYCQCGLDIFFPASENDVYVMVATEIEYDTNAMDIELARHPIDKAQKNDMDIKYLW